MNLIQKYFEAFNRFGNNEAFSLNDEIYTYREFLLLVQGSRKALESQPGYEPQTPVGVLCNERVETYAAVFAIWFSGGIFVPLDADAPKMLNEELVKKHQIKYLFYASENADSFSFDNAKIICNREVSVKETAPLFQWQESHTVYVLNTSGSTGVPKSVPITLKNLSAFIDGFVEKFPELSASDKFLQTYELTADASFTGYLVPFLLGATVYSVPHSNFKPFAVAKILSAKPITWVKATPTLLACLRPFFSSLHLPGLKHFHFGGEALPADLINEWRSHVPNAEISNGYGPTETTITSTIFKCLPGRVLKEKNNVVSIGKPFKNVRIHIQKIDGEDGVGELYIGGAQMMEGYWFAEEQPFKILETDGEQQRFYPTGDKVTIDADGDLYFMGRLNDQVKINGYRVDLVEIENGVRKVVPVGGNVAAIAAEKSPGMKQLVVFVENFKGDEKEIMEKMALFFPKFKIPEKIVGIPVFPVNRSGKTDKKKLAADFYLNSKQ
ncbi:amino acid adenylation domain-containing protein [Mariniphaga anaerophila]|uniref:Amino acid adenylation domain-containing protein n=1 Tax=Mariniphaga anaerophila TaxID=1484053 RepID=A0A1M5B8J0_9BACT|nr:AMP-binding protein [Mariniphaga anaerophila]SHF38755.1 amino acid adenylation domain-containing protein [Mariniphaga anaerophila]